MDWDELYSDPQIRSFLQDFPQQEWKSILKKILLYGIDSYKSFTSVGLTSLNPLPGLQIKIDESKANHPKPRDSSRQITPNRSTSHTNFQRKCGSHSCRHNSHHRSDGKAFKFDKHLPAKQLVGKEICGKGKSVGLGFESRVFMVEDENKGFVIHPQSDEVKKVGGGGLRSVEKVVPKLLRAVELKPGKNHNFSSTSAQVFCSSSEISD